MCSIKCCFLFSPTTRNRFLLLICLIRSYFCTHIHFEFTRPFCFSRCGYRFSHCVSMLCFSVVALAVVPGFPQIKYGYQSLWNTWGCPEPILPCPFPSRRMRVINTFFGEHSTLIFPDAFLWTFQRAQGMLPSHPAAAPGSTPALAPATNFQKETGNPFFTWGLRRKWTKAQLCEIQMAFSILKQD